ncbi:MAG: aldo/keto reductase [Solirubrobacteraceae bacterium]|nr:aldo/keto reductase [Solirubrobacteraceae bacterium]
MATDSSTPPLAHASGTFDLGGELTVHRLGYGAMQITGEGIFGEPKDPDECRRVLQRAVELGVDFFDTADSYGPEVSERLIGEALHPYAPGVVVATKAGLTRPGPSDWRPVGREGYLLQQLELSLRRLRVDRIDLWQLHRIDPATPRAEQFKVLREAQESGKVRLVGLSEVSVEDLEAALSAGVQVATVQNIYNLVNRTHEDVLNACEERGIGFIPWFPMAAGHLAQDDGPLQSIASDHDATPSQLALAWLLKRSPVMLPIPGTSTVAHLEQNLAAATLELSDDEFAALDEAGKKAA